MNKKGLTILEIIIVMAIMLIVASMLIPGLARARRNASRAKCINNLKTIGLMIHMYAIDFKEKFPSKGTSGVDGLAILKEDYITDESGFLCPASLNITPSIDYFFADELTENSQPDSALAVDNANRHDSPKNYNILYVDGHISSAVAPPTGTPGEVPLD